MSGFWQSMRERNRAGTALPADYAPPGGAAGAAGAADLSALAQRLFWGWALLAGVAFFLIWWMQRHGWWVRLIEGDPSGITC